MVNPYESSLTDAPKLDRRAGAAVLTWKLHAWNAVLVLLCIALWSDSYPRFGRKIQQWFTNQNYDLYAVESAAGLLGLLVPYVALAALSTIFLTKRGVVCRTLFLLPLPVIFLHSIPPGLSVIIAAFVYLVAVSPILVYGVGWLGVVQRRFALRPLSDVQIPGG